MQKSADWLRGFIPINKTRHRMKWGMDNVSDNLQVCCIIYMDRLGKVKDCRSKPNQKQES